MRYDGLILFLTICFRHTFPFHPLRMTRARRIQKKLKVYLSQVYRDTQRKLIRCSEHSAQALGVWHQSELATTQTSNFIVACCPSRAIPTMAIPSRSNWLNWSDGRAAVHSGPGYRGHGVDPTQTEVVSRQRWPLTRLLTRHCSAAMRFNRSLGICIEDGWLGRNFLKGMLGDKLNTLLGEVGQNFRAILRHLRMV